MAKSYISGYIPNSDYSSGGDPDEYDDLTEGQVNDPHQPIWDGSEIQTDSWGDDPSSND